MTTEAKMVVRESWEVGLLVQDEASGLAVTVAPEALRDLGRETAERWGRRRLEQLLARAAAAEPWDDVEDEWSDAIREAFPTRSGSHEEYGEAMRMVGHRRSKGELVALVNWLLVRARQTPEGG